MESESDKLFEPLSVRLGLREPFRLVEGVPSHAEPALHNWCTVVLSRKTHRGDYLDLVCAQLRIGISTRDPSTLLNHVRTRTTHQEYFDLLDYLVRSASEDMQESLELLLQTSGSAWRVANPEEGLERRVPAEMEALYERALSPGDAAAERMSNAWRNMFGLHRNSWQAWHEAVCAVEAALGPVVIPKADHQIGKIVPALREAPEGKFTIRLPGKDPKTTLLGMLSAIPYQEGRHSKKEDPIDPVVAEATVFQAAAIVALAADGFIALNPKP